jgi:Family of unknown function (DUF6476)
MWSSAMMESGLEDVPMDKLAPGQAQSDGGEAARIAGTAAGEADAASRRMMARVRLLMVISGVTTLIAIAAVIGVIGYRVSRAGGGARPAAAMTTGIITLPNGARIIASTIAGDRIVVTLDIGGTTEMRIFDAQTLKETSRIRFATEP